MTGLLHGGAVSPKTRGAFGPEHIPVDGFRDLTQRPTCLRQLLVIIFYIYLKGDLWVHKVPTFPEALCRAVLLPGSTAAA